MGQIEPKRIQRLLSGGSLHEGETVAFVIELEGGARLALELAYGLLPKVISSLRTFGALATQARLGRAHNDELGHTLHPYVLKGPPRVLQSTDGRIGAIFPTGEGIPVMVSMAREQAEGLARDLTAELARPPDTRPAN